MYLTGMTKGLGDVSDNRTHVAEIRDVDTYVQHGDLDRIKVRCYGYPRA